MFYVCIKKCIYVGKCGRVDSGERTGAFMFIERPEL